MGGFKMQVELTEEQAIMLQIVVANKIESLRSLVESKYRTPVHNLFQSELEKYGDLLELLAQARRSDSK